MRWYQAYKAFFQAESREDARRITRWLGVNHKFMFMIANFDHICKLNKSHTLSKKVTGLSYDVDVYYWRFDR